MKIYKPEDDKLIVPISDSIVGFKREVEFIELRYFTGADGVNTPEVQNLIKFLEVKFLIHYFQIVEEEVETFDEFDNPITEVITKRINIKSLPSDVREDTFIANYKTYVDMSNGMIIAVGYENLEAGIADLVNKGVYTQVHVDSEDFVVGTQIDYFEKAFNNVNPSLPPEMQGLIPIKPMIYEWAQQAKFKDIIVEPVN